MSLLKSTFFLLFIVPIAMVSGQDYFQRFDMSISDLETHSGVALAVADMNGDFIDDVIFTDDARSIVVAYQNVNGQPFEMRTVFTASQSIWSVAVADANNDGLTDILVCNTSNCDVLINNKITFVPIAVALDHFSQASNMVDINGDGNLDLFVCNDVGPNKVLMADGNDYVLTDMLDDTDGGTYDGSGNYGSTWTDFDRDGDLDLYIAKCRQGVDDPADKRRINRLFENNGGVFTEKAGDFGLDIDRQSWAADFGDLDNDGDLDLYIINHHAANQLFINEDQLYVDRSDWLGEFDNGNGIQCLMADVNNDTYLDIIVTGTRSFIHMNQAGGGFTLIERPLGVNAAESFSLGDFNQDGYIDIAAGYANLFTNPSTKKDLIWTNKGGDHNYFKINLDGIQSNKNGVGAMIELYGAWGVQLREIRSGESYGVSRSLTQYFGLGARGEIDSVRIIWPSGAIDVLKEPLINAHYLAKENICISPIVDLSVTDQKFICPDNTFDLEMVDVEPVVWNTGDIGSSLTIENPGTYSGNLIYDLGCVEGVVKARRYLEYGGHDGIQVSPLVSVCADQTIELRAPAGSEYVWDDGSEEGVRTIVGPGMYSVEFVDLCGDAQTTDIEIDLTEVDVPLGFNDTIATSGQATPWASGDNILWFSDESGSVELGRGDTLFVDVLNDTLFYAANAIKSRYNATQIAAFGMEGEEAAMHLNAKIYFDVMESVFIESILVEAASIGIRKIQIFDHQDVLFFEQDFDLSVGVNTLELDLNIPIGSDYYMTTDESVNIQVQGDLSPRLLYYRMNDHFPIGVDPRLHITSTSLGTNFYFYFYNWTIYSESFCLSDLVPVTVEVDVVSSTRTLIPSNQIEVYPNPTSDILNIIPDADLNLAKITFFDALGRLVYSAKISDRTVYQKIDLSDWASGMYTLRVTDEEGRVFVQKIVR